MNRSQVDEIARVHRESEVAWRAWRDANWLRDTWTREVDRVQRSRIHAAYLSGFAAGRAPSEPA